MTEDRKLEGFTLWVHPRPGLTAAMAADFSSRLKEFLARRGIVANTMAHCRVLWSPERSLGAADQISLIGWLVNTQIPVALWMSPPSADFCGGAGPDQTGFLEVASSDLTLVPLVLLYGCGRISAEQALQILGGYTAPQSLAVPA